MIVMTLGNSIINPPKYFKRLNTEGINLALAQFLGLK